MKIGMMSSWNTDSGASVHAELVGREWVKMGHSLKVFSFIKKPGYFHGTTFVAEDEDYVIRCFSCFNAPQVFFDPRPFLLEDYEIFIGEDIGMFPLDELSKIYRFIQKKAKTVNVIHTNVLPDRASFYQIDFDAIVCFDDRFYQFLTKVFPPKKIHIIPYPCNPHLPGNKIEARKELNLPLYRKIILTFGPNAVKFHLIELSDAIEKLKDKYPITFLIVTLRDIDKIEPYKDKFDIIVREESPDITRLYKYLYASDVLLYNKIAKEGAVLSSTAFQTLGSEIPIVALKSSYTYGLEDVLFEYTNKDELIENIIEIFQEGERYKKWKSNLIKFLNQRSASAIAEKFIKLFKKL